MDRTRGLLFLLVFVFAMAPLPALPQDLPPQGRARSLWGQIRKGNTRLILTLKQTENRGRSNSIKVVPIRVKYIAGNINIAPRLISI